MVSLETIKERVKVTETGCWEWQGGRDADGYGYTTFAVVAGKNTHSLTRQLWAAIYGNIPAGMCVLHRCDNPPCCNPAHLFLGSHADNVHDKFAKGRAIVYSGSDHWTKKRPEAIPKGSIRGQAKLTEEIVKEIRQRKTTRSCSIRALVKQLAAEYGVCNGTIQKVIWNKKWKHVA